jgi:hypothetical protein
MKVIGSKEVQPMIEIIGNKEWGHWNNQYLLIGYQGGFSYLLHRIMEV